MWKRQTDLFLKKDGVNKIEVSHKKGTQLHRKF